MNSKKEKFKPEEHWKGMPAFSQPEVPIVKKLIVNFADKESMLKFSKLVGQEITAKTQSIWFPPVDKEDILSRRWMDTEQIKK